MNVAELTRGRRGSAPPMTAIVDYWRVQPISDTPALKSYYIGWGEPFCFACGWLPPVEDGRRDSWLMANMWLDRAHLRNHCHGGDNKPHNLVPLCHPCHQAMPEFWSKGPALQWVIGRDERDGDWQQWTDWQLEACWDVTHGATMTQAHKRFLQFSEITRAAGCSFLGGLVELYRGVSELEHKTGLGRIELTEGALDSLTSTARAAVEAVGS